MRRPVGVKWIDGNGEVSGTRAYLSSFAIAGGGHNRVNEAVTITWQQAISPTMGCCTSHHYAENLALTAQIP